jgi:dihydroorotate dehydrogenase electron transfer subunit
MIEIGQVTENVFVEKNIFKITIELPQISRHSTAGQFCEIKVSDGLTPLLRRPFSISFVNGKEVTFLIEIKGVGTEMLARTKPGELLNVLGPLGKGFNTDGNFETAVLVAGGIGVAPFPFLTQKLKEEKRIFTFLGSRTKTQIVSDGLENILIATDDGSAGAKGTVVQLLEKEIEKFKQSKLKIFACGPNPMLKALKELTTKHMLDCEVSTESNMACGIGLCQGCAIKSAVSDGYFLVCKDGPVFNINDVEF